MSQSAGSDLPSSPYIRSREFRGCGSGAYANLVARPHFAGPDLGARDPKRWSVLEPDRTDAAANATGDYFFAIVAKPRLVL